MQKKLLTLAVAGALAAPGLALAQSSVEVYGIINMSFNKWKFSEGTNAAAAPSMSKWDVASYGSAIGVRGRETLGGGLSAWFQVETNAAMERSNNVAHASGIASRNSAVGLQGGFGNAFIGQWTTPWADLDALWSVGAVHWGPALAIIGRRESTGTVNHNCANIGSGVGAAPGGNCDSVEAISGVGHPFWRRISNSVFYQSPVFAGGLQAKLAWQPNQEKAVGPTVVNQDPSMWSGSLQWAGMGGRARAGLSVDRHKDFTTVGMTDTGWAVKGGWNFGVADVGLAYERMTYKTPAGDCKATQYAVALAVPVGQGAIRTSYAVAKDIEGTYTTPVVNPVGAAAATGSCGAAPTALAPTDDNGAKYWSIGYDHRFSKRTTVGAGYVTIKNDAGAGGNQFTFSGGPTTQSSASLGVPLGTDLSSIFVSITHRF